CARCRPGRSAVSGSKVGRNSNPGTPWRPIDSSGKKFRQVRGLLTAEVVMTSYRADQVGEQVREEIMSIIRRDLKDPRIGFVSITAVRMSSDLRQARVRVSVLGSSEEQKDSIKGLVSAKGWMRHELGRRLQNVNVYHGSRLAFAEALRSEGKDVWVLVPPPLPPMYAFLPRFEEIQAEPPHGVDPQLVFFFDSGNLERSGNAVRRIAAHATIVNIDHHPSNSR